MPLCKKFNETLPNISPDTEWKPFQMTFNDLHDLEKKVQVMRFKLGLHHELVLLCTKYGEDTSNIYSDFER